jgi:hypothetical protein
VATVVSPADFTDAVMRYAALTGASATSWFRTVKHNGEVGGVAHSAHVAGLAVDVVYDPPMPTAEWRTDWARRLGLRLVIEGDHDHLQPADWQAG